MTEERLSPNPEQNANTEGQAEQEWHADLEAACRAIELLSDREVIAAMRLSYEHGNEADDPFNFSDVFDRAMTELPKRDADRSRSLFQELAGSPHSGDRYTAALQISGLTEVDHDAGMTLWERLVRDKDLDVRESAYRHVDGLLQRGNVSALGLTLDDALHLRHSYEQAEQGRNIHDPDRDAYSRFAELMSIEREAILHDQDSTEN